jgi:hypothetical protein
MGVTSAPGRVDRPTWSDATRVVAPHVGGAIGTLLVLVAWRAETQVAISWGAALGTLVLAPVIVATARTAGRRGLPHASWLRGVRRALVGVTLAGIATTALVATVQATLVTLPRAVAAVLGGVLIVVDAVVRTRRARQAETDDDPETVRLRTALTSTWTWMVLLATLLAAQALIDLLS